LVVLWHPVQLLRGADRRRLRMTSESSMRRRDFIKGTTALAGGALAADALHGGVAWAQDKGESLLVVLEGAPNSLDFHVAGANRQVYEVVWNI